MTHSESLAAPANVPPTLAWQGDIDGCLQIIDQTLLPGETTLINLHTAEDVWESIRSLRVRGAPAIGVSAAYGVILGLQAAATTDRDTFDAMLHDTLERLATSRPTAVNLFWALDRMRACAETADAEASGQAVLAQLLAEARTIEAEDRQMCADIGRFGAELVNVGDRILTHCNAGGLATAGDGTALSVIFAAHAQGKQVEVYADETRPLLQGARLTTWELQQRGIPVTLICDSAAGHVMQSGRVNMVVTGADRIAANGDVANKVGTYSVAVLAHRHRIPFYVAAPSSTFDLALPDGSAIPIEERLPEEVLSGFGRQTAPDGTVAFNPAFDVTPHELIAGIITERGVVTPNSAEAIAAHLA